MGMLINMSVVGDTVQKGDILELTYKNKSGTTTDQVIVAAMYESAGGTHGQDDVVVFNAEGHTVGLDLYDLLTSTTGGITSLTDTFSISRIPQTLVLDSTGATAVSASGRNFGRNRKKKKKKEEFIKKNKGKKATRKHTKK